MPEFVDGKPIIPSVLMRDKSQDKSQLYQGNCHCGAVVYKVNLIPPFPEHLVIRCNCSKCSKNGNMNVYPERKHVEWIRGSDTLKGYKFGSKENTYMFCGTCGNNVMIVIDPELARKHGQPEVLAMNVRMFKDFDGYDETIDGVKLQFEQFDGKNKFLPFYECPS